MQTVLEILRMFLKMNTLHSVRVHLRPFCRKRWALCSRFLDGITPRWVSTRQISHLLSMPGVSLQWTTSTRWFSSVQQRGAHSTSLWDAWSCQRAWCHDKVWSCTNLRSFELAKVFCRGNSFETSRLVAWGSGRELISQIEFFVYLALLFDCREALFNRVSSWHCMDRQRSCQVRSIKGSPDSLSGINDESIVQQLELEMPSLVWLERLSSFSNPSDMPSRKQVKQAARLIGAESGVLRVPNHLVDSTLLMYREQCASLNGLSNSSVTGNALVTFTPAVKKMLPKVSTENRFCLSFVGTQTLPRRKGNKFVMTLFFTLHVLLTAVPIGHAFYNIPATDNTDERQPFVFLRISRKFDKVLRLNPGETERARRRRSWNDSHILEFRRRLYAA